MAAVPPESKPASGAGSGTGSDASGLVDAPGLPQVGPSADPDARPVNKGGIPTSNSKGIRAREAEEDRALIAKAQAGDTAAFRSLVERHQRRAFAIAYSLVRDEHDARELVQDAFLRVFKGLGTFQGGSSFFTWLYRIVTNLSIDLMRKPGRRRPGGLRSPERRTSKATTRPTMRQKTSTSRSSPASTGPTRPTCCAAGRLRRASRPRSTPCRRTTGASS